MKDFVRAITALEIDSATLVDGVFMPFAAGGLPEACFLIRIINASDLSVQVSYDGENVHDYVEYNGTIQLQFQTNSSPNNKRAQLAKGTNIGLFGNGQQSTGLIYLVGYYQE